MLIYSLPQNLEFTKKRYIGWGILMETLTESRLKSSDLRQVLGLTYRQINDWDNRGILQTYRNKSEEQAGSGWRKFSIAELVPLAILVELKKQGIPVSKLLSVTETLFMTDMALYEFFPNIVYGIGTYFFTDLETFTGYDCVDPVRQSIEFPIYSLEDIRVLMVLPLKPIVENVFSKLDLSDFSARINKAGQYDFTINGVPLALEPLPKNPTTEEIQKASHELLPKQKGE